MDDRHTPTPIPLPVPVEQSQARGLPAVLIQNRQTDEHPINVTRLSVPLPLVAAIFATLLGGIVSMTLVWAKTVGHAGDRTMHVDPEDATKGGGVAYKNDVTATRTDFETRLVQEQKKTRKLLKSMSIRCKKARNGEGFECTTDIPEVD